MSANAFARAYGLPVLPLGTWHTVVLRPLRPYLLIIENVNAEEPATADPVEVLQKEKLREWPGFQPRSPLLPLELLLLAIELPDRFLERGLTAGGAVLAAQAPDVKRPTGYPHSVAEVQAAFADAYRDAYFPSLVKLADGPLHWIVHQGPHGRYGVPLAWQIV